LKQFLPRRAVTQEEVLAQGATRPPRLLRGQWQSEIRVIGG